MSKRILIVSQHFWPENFRINDIANYFVENGHQVDVICGRPNYPSGKLSQGYSLWNRRKEVHGNITIYRSFEIPRGDNSNFRIFANYISFPIASLLRIPRFAFKSYDAIFLYQLSPVMMSISGLLIGRLRHTPTTMYVLDLWPENLLSVLPISNRVLRGTITKISHWHYRNADKLIALSASMQRRLSEITGKSINDIEIVPQAAEKLYEHLIYDKTLHHRYNGKFTIVFTGNVSPAQSFATMLKAAKILKERHGNRIHWIVVGDGMSLAGVVKEVGRLKLTSVFSFEGYQPIQDIPKYSELADVLVGCLVKSELLEATIPAKVMSYIAAGRPTVLAMDGEVQTLINDVIGCGFAGPAEDATEFANNIEKVYELSETERQALGSKARTYHAEHFERNILLKRLLNVIFTPSKL